MIWAFFSLWFIFGGQYPAEADLSRKIIDDGKAYIGYKYRARVNTGFAFDCSGFVSHILWINGIEVSRSSASMSRDVEVIPIEHVQPGDLLFFKGRDSNSSHIGHVAMVAEIDGSIIYMIHATRRGIVLEEYKDDYYTRRFVHAGRLPKHVRACLDEVEPSAIEWVEGPGISDKARSHSE